MTRDDIDSAIEWIARNRGFVSVVLGFGGVISAILITCGTITWYLAGVINTNERRHTASESRLEVVEDTLTTLAQEVRFVRDEQIRRAAAVENINEIYDAIKRIEQHVEEGK